MSVEVEHIIRPAAVGTHQNYSLTGAATTWEALDPGYPMNHDKFQSFLSHGSGANGLKQTQKSDQTFPTAALITDVAVYVRGVWITANGSDGTGMMMLSATEVFSSDTSDLLESPNWADYELDFTSNRPGGGTWTDADFRESTFEFGIRTGIPASGANYYTSLWVRVLYIPSAAFISGFREIFSRKLRRSRSPEEVYSAAVPLKFLALELLDSMSVSHEAIPRAATLLEDLQIHQLMDDWRRQYALMVGQRINLNDLTLEIDWENQESTHALAWSTDQLPAAVNDSLDGLAQFDMGAVHTFTRGLVSHVQQWDKRIATVEAGLPKMNHLGFLADEEKTNDVLNSNAQSDYDSIWTQTLNSGTIAEDTDELFFINETSFPHSVSIVKGSGGVTHQTQVFAVLAADLLRTVSIFHKDTAGDVCSWRLQRSSDSEYWNDATPDWQAGDVWNSFATSTDIIREVSDVIVCDANENWTLDVGVATGSTGDKVWIGQVDCTEGPYVVAPITTTDAATVTAPEDERYFVLDETDGRQQWPAAVGTFRATIEIENATDRIQDGESLCLVYGQIGSGTTDYDALILRKAVATNPELVFKRKRDGIAADSAVLEVDLARGDVVEVAARWTGAGELGLEDYTLSVLADGVKGTDATSASHSTSEDYTEVWIGCVPAALGLLRAMQYIRNWEIIPRALADEEIEARR